MSPQRTCPKCATPQEIAAESALWPNDWRCTHCGFAHDHRNGFVQLAPALDDVNEGFELASYEVLHRIEEGHFWFTARNRMIRWLIERFAPRASRGLEIGCGTGYVLFALRAALPLVRSLTVRSLAILSLAGMRSAVRTRCRVWRGIGGPRRGSAAGAHMLREGRGNSEARAQHQRKHTPDELEFSAHATLHLLIRLTRIILLLL